MQFQKHPNLLQHPQKFLKIHPYSTVLIIGTPGMSHKGKTFDHNIPATRRSLVTFVRFPFRRNTDSTAVAAIFQLLLNSGVATSTRSPKRLPTPASLDLTNETDGWVVK